MSQAYTNGHPGKIPYGGPPNAAMSNRPNGMSLEQATQLQIRQQAEAGALRPGFAPNPPGAPHPAFALHAQQQQQQQQAALVAQQQRAALAARPPPAAPSIHGPSDGGPAYAVPLWPLFTRVTAIEPGLPFPSIDEQDQPRLKGWMERDLAYERELKAIGAARRQELAHLGEDLSRAQDWMGVDGPRARFGLRIEKDRLKERERGKRGGQRKELTMSKAQLLAVAKQKEVLIPIRLEWEHEVYKLRDTFTWNLKDSIVTPEVFASHLCEDLRLPTNPFFKEIVNQIKRHIEDAQFSIEYDAHVGKDLSSIREASREWFDRQARLRHERDNEVEVEGLADEEEKKLTVEELPGVTGMSDELRVTIKLDITLDSIQLVDKFDWDISDPDNSPEQFAATFAADLGLSGEFETAIAHSIREQIDIFTRSLCILGYGPGHLIADEDLRREFLPPVAEVFRPNAPELGPLLNQLTPEEVDRNDKEREREVRRKRRQTKGRGVTLPDRDPVKTHRSIVPKPSTVPLHSFMDNRGDMVYPMPELNHPFPLVADEIPEKPKDIEPITASPLRLVLAKNAAAGQAPAATSSASVNPGKFKRKADIEAAAANGEAPPPPPPKRQKPRVDPAVYGLHEHMIEGQWHCACCGCPAVLAVGRRKGPTGEQTLCGTCGKFYHRYRKQRTCEYTTDFAHHQAAAAANAKANPPKKSAALTRLKRGQPPVAPLAAPALPLPAQSVDGETSAESASGMNSEVPSLSASRLQSPDHSDDDDEDDDDDDHNDNDDDDQSDASSNEDKVRAPRRRPGRLQPDSGEDLPYVRVGSPDSDTSSRASQSPPPPPPAQLEPPAPPPAAEVAHEEPTEATAPPPEPLPWMLEAAAELKAKQVDERFEIIPRPRPPDPSQQEWRVRCLDCPGKLYNLGPGETLDNFSVHFKNRQHRSNVEARLKTGGTPA